MWSLTCILSSTALPHWHEPLMTWAVAEAVRARRTEELLSIGVPIVVPGLFPLLVWYALYICSIQSGLWTRLSHLQM